VTQTTLARKGDVGEQRENGVMLFPPMNSPLVAHHCRRQPEISAALVSALVCVVSSFLRVVCDKCDEYYLHCRKRVDPNCFGGGCADETVAECECALLGCKRRRLRFVPSERSLKVTADRDEIPMWWDRVAIRPAP